MIARVPVKGYFEVNCYFWIDDETKHGFLIDPGAQGHELMRLCRKNGWIIEKILLTHGHFDHIGGIAAIREEADKLPVLLSGLRSAPACFFRFHQRKLILRFPYPGLLN